MMRRKKSEFNETRQSIDSVKQQMQVNLEGQADQFNADLQGVADALGATTNQNHESVMSHLGLITGDVKNVNDQVLTNEKRSQPGMSWQRLGLTMCLLKLVQLVKKLKKPISQSNHLGKTLQITIVKMRCY